MGFEETFRSVAFTLSRSIVFIAHAFAFGVLPVLLLVLRPSFASLDGGGWERGRARLAEHLEGLLQSALVASFVATSVGFVLQAALVAEAQGGEIGSDSFSAVANTPFGQWFLLRYPLLAGLAVLLVKRVRTWSLAGAGDDRRGPGRSWWIGWAALSLGLLATSTLSGHTSVARPLALAVITDLLHLVSGGIWFAGIVVLAFVLPDGWAGQDALGRLRLLTPAIVRFSNLALVSIAALLITGTLNSLFHIGKLSDLWETGYGRALSIKILLFLAILALGGLNHLFVRRRLERALEAGRKEPAEGVFRKTIATELLIGVLVLGVTGFLVGSARTKGAPEPVRDEPVTSAPTS